MMSIDRDAFRFLLSADLTTPHPGVLKFALDSSCGHVLRATRPERPYESNRQRCGFADGTQGKRRLHLPHTRQSREILSVNTRKIFGVFGHNL